MLLDGKTIVVTGANSGIGEAIVVAAAAEGANVVINFHSRPEDTAALVKRIEADGGRAIGVEGDVSKVADLETLISAAVDEFGRLDVFVNNAGIDAGGSILATSEHDFARVMDVNIKGAFFGTQLAAKQFIAQSGPGVVINISSVHEDWPMPDNIAYCVSKGGMRMLTRTAGVELADHGIRVVNVAPGAVATPINAETMNDPEEREALTSSIPAGRVAKPVEIAQLVTFLASDRASYMTSTTVFVDGGIMQASIGL